MRLRAEAASVVLLAASATACGANAASDDSLAAGGGALAGSSSVAAAGANSRGATAPNTGGANSGGNVAGNGAAGQPANVSGGHGQVVLAHQAGGAGIVELRTSFDRGPAVTCPTVATYGSCALTLCPTTDATNPSAPLSAGAVSATSASVALQVVATPDAQAAGGYLQAQQTLTGDFKGGETITLAAAGADVPAFSHDLKMLSPPVLTKPAATETSIPIGRAGVELASQPGEAGTEVSVVAFGSGSEWTSMICSWDASLGAGSVPAEALKLLPDRQELFITGRRDALQNAGNFVVQLSLVTSARTATDARARALVLTDSL